ncbi:MAG TPA: phospholipase D-like domain-containing protein [Devosia sp.]|jgi:phosphatidylserine/phosphatidylglycerophosphate/cardiolipin synthase-like enzyme|nr:phospholipase D-like domain-containing protein [Devosia sp.]
MRILTPEAKASVQAVITASMPQLQQQPGFVSAEPGFPIIDGAVVPEPAVIVHVAVKRPPEALLPEERIPRQLGRYRVCVMQADPEEQLRQQAGPAAFAAAAAATKSSLTYDRLPNNPIDTAFTVKKPMLCHVGPDAGWPVLQPFLAATKKTLSVAMYDLNADYIAKSFIDTVLGNKLKVVLTWDEGMTAAETAIRKKLRAKLGKQLDGWIVNTGNGFRFQNAYHEKVAVRDSTSFWLSSGNWTLKSQPNIDPIGTPAEAHGMYSRGNREWHVIVEDGPLAKLFERYIKYDRDKSEDESKQGVPNVALGTPPGPRRPDLFVPIEQLAASTGMALDIPEPIAPQALPTDGKPVKVQPLLTPDNYIKHIVELIKKAKSSIYLQYAYITWNDDKEDQAFRDMLLLLGQRSYESQMDVRIIVGSGDAGNKVRKLVENGFNPKSFKKQSPLHNKGIVVDSKIALVSSANWSGDGVLRNRDAGLLIYNAEIAQYYEQVFLFDWDNRASGDFSSDPVALVADVGEPAPPGMVRMSWDDYYGE